jgi:hypothetical protein
VAVSSKTLADIIGWVSSRGWLSKYVRKMPPMVDPMLVRWEASLLLTHVSLPRDKISAWDMGGFCTFGL